MPLPMPLDASDDEVRAALAPLRHDFSIALFNANNAFAVGAIIRVAHSFLASEIVLIGSEPYYEKASMGMHKYENLVRVPDADAFFEHTRGRPVWALEREAARVSLGAVATFPPGVVFLFGSERFGVPSDVIARVDNVVGIQMYGINNSFPIAIAAGIVMHQWTQRRYAHPTMAGQR